MARKPPASFVPVYCRHGAEPRLLGHFHPGVTEVWHPSCTTRDGAPRSHPGPKAGRGRARA